MSFKDYASGIRLPGCFKLAINRKNNNEIKICRHDVIVKFFDIVLLLLPILVTGPCFMLKSKISPSDFEPISGDWVKLGIPNLARISLLKPTVSPAPPSLPAPHTYTHTHRERERETERDRERLGSKP